MAFFEDLPERTICISHNRDVDGLVSAAFLRHVTKCGILLTDYDRVIQTLEMVDGPTNLFICDLGIDKEIEFPLLQHLQRIVNKTGVCYIDHHPIGNTLIEKLSNIGVKVTHSSADCSSAITYWLYKDKLPKEAALLAACGALTDRIEDGPIARNVLKRYDRDLVMLESSILSYTIAEKGDDDEFLLYLTDELANFKLPHEIPNLCQYACSYGQRMMELSKIIAKSGTKMKNLAYILTKERNLGSVANLLIGEFDAPVGVAYRYKQDTNRYIISLRSNGLARNLGELTSKVASMLDGIGGGHLNASGAVVPSRNVLKFLELLDEQLCSTN